MKEEVISVPGMRLAVRVHGPDDGAPIVALHGMLDNAATFDRLAPLLPQHRIYAVDMAGHGHSDHHAPDAGYEIIHAVAELHHAVTALGLPERFILMGHSIGAAISLLYAGAFPERVRKLIALDGLGPMIEAVETSPQRLHNAVLDEKRDSKTRVFPDIDTAARALMQATTMLPESARLLVTRGLKEVQGGYSWRSDPRIRSASRMRLTEDHVAAFMRDISAPVFIVLASNGWAAMPDAVELRLGYLANKQIHRVDGTHHVHLDAPETFISPLQRFLQTD